MIEIKDLRTNQGDFLLEIPRLYLPSGELVAVCGNNGSGKSTFLSVLAGGKDYSGQYYLKGVPFREWDLKKRAQQLSFLPQEGAVNMPFEVAYVVLTGRFPWIKDRKGYTSEDWAKVEEILKYFDLIELKQRPFNELSGGEKRRVLLARALVREAEVILLDEPFSAVDLKHQHRIMKFLEKISQNRLLIVVMHDLNLALRYFKRFLLFKKGRLIYDLQREEIRADKLSYIFEVPIKVISDAHRLMVEVSDEEAGYSDDLDGGGRMGGKGFRPSDCGPLRRCQPDP